MNDHPSPTILRRMLLALVSMALLATACGSDPVVLQGDVAQTEPTQATESATPSAASGTAEETQAGQETPEPDAEQGEVVEEVAIAEPTPDTNDATAQQVVATGGAVDTITDVRFSVGETVATDAAIQSYIAGANEPDESSSWLVTELSAESLRDVTWSIRNTNISLVDPDGGRYPASRVFDSVGDERALDLDGRDSQTGRVAFPTNELVDDTTGWLIEINAGETIPLLMPLSGSRFDHRYPFNLVDGAESSATIGPFAGCESAVFDTRVDEITVGIEAQGDGVSRMPSGERVVAVSLTLTGTTQAGAPNEVNCGSTLLWPDPVLNVDGRPAASSSFRHPDIEGLSSVTIDLEFQVPSTATELELAIGTNSLANWAVTFPPAVGEPEADLVPFNATRSRPVTSVAMPTGPRPAVLTTETVSAGGATGTMLQTIFGVRESVATNSLPDAYVSSTPALDESRTWLIVGLDVESSEDVSVFVGNNNFVLEDPAGRPITPTTMYNRTGDRESGFALNGAEYRDLRLAFETNGLVSDLADWHLFIEQGDLIPLELPMSGSSPTAAYPAFLPTPVGSEVPTDAFPSCDAGGVVDAVIETAAVTVEDNAEEVRVDRGELMITMEVTITNLQDTTVVDGNGNCGALLVWPEFLLDVDGRLTRSLFHRKPSLDQFESGTLSLRFVIPDDSQRISLIGGSGKTIVGTFELRDAGQVLEDFGAAEVDERTVITLDETLLFAFGESELQQSAFAPLTRVANVVNSESTGRISVIGHTDSIGDGASNQTLSEARAQAVAEALIAAGVDPARLDISGQGENSPVAPNQNDDGSDNPSGRQMNRRVEVSFATDG